MAEKIEKTPNKTSFSLSSSGDEKYAKMDEKKRKRMISNRESARRSRMRREQRVKDLSCQLNFFKNSNDEIVQKINSIMRQSMVVDLENRMLTLQRDELARRLESLEIVSSYVCEYEKDIIPLYNYSEPWQFPYPSVPLMASVGMFPF